MNADQEWRPQQWPEWVDEASGEPVGEWQTARQLHTTEIVSIILCKFTGDRTVEGGSTCPHRAVSHPDEECSMQYWSADAITSGFIPTEMTAPEVRAVPGADPTFVEPSQLGWPRA